MLLASLFLLWWSPEVTTTLEDNVDIAVVENVNVAAIKEDKSTPAIAPENVQDLSLLSTPAKNSNDESTRTPKTTATKDAQNDVPKRKSSSRNGTRTTDKSKPVDVALTNKTEQQQPQNPNTSTITADATTGDGSVLWTSHGLSQQLSRARSRLTERLVELYGDEHSQTLFHPWVEASSGQYHGGRRHHDLTEMRQVSSIGDHFLFKSPGQLGGATSGKNQTQDEDCEGAQVPPTPDRSHGWNRMVRKFQIKLLQVQLGIIEEEQEQQQTTKGSQPKKYHATYNWMTGGTGYVVYCIGHLCVVCRVVGFCESNRIESRHER